MLVIGAGFSGICMGIKLKERGEQRFRIVEKSAGIGGTWYENTYPGASCDVPSHFYSYSFRPNPDWSRAYSPSAEIRRYLEGCVAAYGLRPHIEFGAQVVALELHAEQRCWRAEFADGESEWPAISSSGSIFVVRATRTFNTSIGCPGRA